MRKNLIMLNSKSGAVLLLTLLVTIFLSIIMGAAMMRANVQIREVLHRKMMQESFYAAEAGIDTAIYNLRQNGSWKPGQGGNPPIVDEPFEINIGGNLLTIGFYSIEVENGVNYNGWETRWITAIGKNDDQKVARTIKARVIVESPARFLISTMGPLRIISGSTLNADVLANKVYFDVNNALPSPANEINVNGDVYYIDTKAGDTNPAVIWGGGKTTYKTPSITFAGVDSTRYETLSQAMQIQNQGYFSAGNLTVNLSDLSPFDQGGSLPFNPQIIYAKGDIRINGDYDKSILIAAGGNIYIDGNIVPRVGAPIIPQIGLFAKGDVIIPESTSPGGDLRIEGFIIADGANTGSLGAFYAQGPRSSKGNLDFKGSIAVRGNNTGTGVDLNVYSTRQYNFNSELKDNRTIPFTPFIVNIIEWQEI